MIIIKTERELTYMRDAGRLVAETFQEIKGSVKPGVSTRELDAKAEDYILKKGAKPAFKGYGGFPATLCTSINEEVVHGIPGLRKLENGDIISIDCGAVINGFVGDSALTLPVGEISHEAQELLRVTEESLYAGIAQAVEGNRLSDVSHAVQQCIEGQGMSVVRDYVGHGIGAKMHEDPQIPNYGRPGRGPRLKKGMTLAIEPMVNLGTFEVRTLPDNWTVVTLDGRLSAHFEHTIAITDDTPEILTKL
ncbi:type I methionyl aminopeptidase [Desulforamulus ruminis]|uniref:Methionine aminopeptidase n=1 Tax=Desulforamulus ruminis (strain ATCC 23193 / DSM 2154 / NCIMB 8452 / DL) TaxID=696281 RepID=F6DPE3_DESRL|nr:type I methionyl aminopeptidase [Desulforamulus ruminis]AEG58616.1 methionine aminopeptidase, type I [Desulforamulus ruminis DSM 2154]